MSKKVEKPAKLNRWAIERKASKVASLYARLNGARETNSRIEAALYSIDKVVEEHFLAIDCAQEEKASPMMLRIARSFAPSHAIRRERERLQGELS